MPVSGTGEGVHSVTDGEREIREEGDHVQQVQQEVDVALYDLRVRDPDVTDAATRLSPEEAQQGLVLCQTEQGVRAEMSD